MGTGIEDITKVLLTLQASTHIDNQRSVLGNLLQYIEVDNPLGFCPIKIDQVEALYPGIGNLLRHQEWVIAIDLLLFIITPRQSHIFTINNINRRYNLHPLPPTVN